jgi:hypothetical protein
MESIYATESLAVFSTELGRKFRKDLPSWVPDWEAPGGYTYASRTDTMHLYHASLRKATPTSVELHHSVLKIQGKLIGRVTKVGEVMWGDNAIYCRGTLRRWWSLLEQDWKFHNRSQIWGYDWVYPDAFEQACILTFYETICAGVIHDSHANPDVRRLEPLDEERFAAWASFPIPFLCEKICRLLLWPDEIVLETCVQSTDQRTDRFYPSRLVNDPLEGARVLDELLGYFYTSSARAKIFEVEGTLQVRRNAPWKKIPVRVREYLLSEYRPYTMDMVRHTTHNATIDKSIIFVTLSRRLICGAGLVG